MADGLPVAEEIAGPFRDALIAGDQVDAELIALEAVTEGMPLADLYVDVMAPALAGVDLEGHVVGLRMLADLAEGAGFDVRYLGASVPVDALVDLVARLRSDVVCLSVSITTPASSLLETVGQLTQRRDLRVMIGGSGVPEDLRADARVVYAPDVREALVELERLAA